jgi:hypothetical protein
MSFAAGSQHELSYVAESEFGVTPNTPTMKRFRNAGTTLNLTKESFVSNELRADRMISDVRHGTQRVGGDVNIELSYGAFDDILAGALFGNWTGDVLKAGTTFKSFTIERRFTDIASYLKYKGCVSNGLTLSITPGGMVTGTIPFIGRELVTTGGSLGSPSDVATKSPFDAFTGAITEGGSPIAVVTSIELNLQNGLEPAFVVGSNKTPRIIPGRSNLTGTVSAYFENTTMLEKFVAETESSIEVELEDTEGNVLAINVPRIKYSGADAPVQGEGGVTINMPFQALRDNSEATSLVLTRTAAY